MLTVQDLHVSYRQSPAIRGVSFQVRRGETVAVMGRNGMGKTTLLKALIGLLPAHAGSVALEGDDLTHAPSHQRVRRGMGYVPQGRMIFPYLTVEENLRTGLEASGQEEIPEDVYGYFPELRTMGKRRGGNLSGGQQQQLALARALVARPKVLLLDEPTEGIQPSVIKEIAATLNRLKADRGLTILLSEQVLSFAMELADRFLIIERGEFVHEEDRQHVDRERVHAYLAV
ncbi:MAG: urea ABC transporter ATP-binding subunit UrtE [Deltaproteobacteria bacterium]|nr:urea ABC transporter ATP-binding subunit UrtE [Deltaproteobacteria bacterium]